jgi:hypothetical protein
MIALRVAIAAVRAFFSMLSALCALALRVRRASVEAGVWREKRAACRAPALRAGRGWR